MVLLVTVCNYLFHAFASRALGPEEYGGLVSLLAVVGVLSIPSQAIQMVMAATVAGEDAHGRQDRLLVLARSILGRVVLLGLGMALVLILAGGFGMRFFKLRSLTPWWAVSLAGFVCLVLPAARGWLQGLQRFGALGANLVSDALLRLLFGAALFTAGLGMTGGILAGAFSGAVATGFALLLLRTGRAAAPMPPVSAQERSKIYRYGLPSLATFGAFAVLSNLDVMLVRHYFPAEPAGYYSAASVVGKAFLFLPLAIAQVMFPKARVGHARTENTRGLLDRSLGLTLVLLVVGLVGAWLLARPIILTMFGTEFLTPQTLGLVRVFGLAIAPLALTYVVMQYNLAVDHIRIGGVLIASIAVLLGGLLLWHRTLEQVLWVLGCSHLLLLIVGYAFTGTAIRRRGRVPAGTGSPGA